MLKKTGLCLLVLGLALLGLGLAFAEDAYIAFDASADKTSIAVGESVTLHYILPEKRDGMVMICSPSLTMDSVRSGEGYSYISKALPGWAVPLDGLSGALSYTLTDEAAARADSLVIRLELKAADGAYLGSRSIPLKIQGSVPSAPVQCVITPDRFSARLGDLLTAAYAITPSDGVQLDSIRFWATMGEGLIPVREVTALYGTVSYQVTGTYSARFKMTVETADGWLCEFYSADVRILDEGMNLHSTGWQQIGQAWYYGDASGFAVRGLRKIGDYRYFFDLKTCEMKADAWCEFAGIWYYAGSDGALYQGRWLEDQGDWYCFDGNTGAMCTGWHAIGGQWYFFTASGTMVTGWQQADGAWYYLDPSGAMATGWRQVDGAWYYLDSSGAMVSGWRMIHGQWELFGENGAWICTWEDPA